MAKPTMAVTPNFVSSPSAPSISHLLQSSISVAHLKQLHAHLLKHAYLTHHLSSPQFLSSLLSISLSQSSLKYTLSFFLSSPDPSYHLSLAFKTLPPRQTLIAYSKLRQAGFAFDRFGMCAVLRSVAKDKTQIADLNLVHEAHGFGVKMGFDFDPFVQTALVGAYAKVGKVPLARKVFDRMLYRDLIAWSSMLDSYCQTGNYNDALNLFEELKLSGLKPDRVVLSTVLSACARLRNLKSGKTIHSYIIESNLSLDPHLQNSLISLYSSCGEMETAEALYHSMSDKNLVASTSMVFGYAKLGRLDTARKVFDEMPEKDLISWSALISGYAESERPDKALELFKKMQLNRVKPDEVTMLSLISACANIGALDSAKRVCNYVKSHCFDEFLSVGNALIDMFAKCGSLSDARKVFDEMPKKNVITWTSMIMGFAMHGDGRSALALFEQMKGEKGIKPNRVTFVSLLYACSHSGLVEEGQALFKSMVSDYNIEPKHEHYGCLVDLYGRAKLLSEAVSVIENMPFKPNVVVWGSLLGACKVHGNVELGELAAKRILELDPVHDGAYVLLSNIYAKAGRSNDVREVREIMKFRGLSKERGFSWLELGGEMHAFMTGDESHPRRNEIYHKLRDVVARVEKIGYSPDVTCVLINLDEEEKREAVLLHSEKLALSFGLIGSERGACLRISKNIRVCEDCHAFVKLVSRAYGREIVLRDRTRFHHFKDGICSCGDFW
ncbi:hypothetical protein LUZ60_004658 [Juncus effusus]|nr:hypothetical protein LUZ60_004658 [Juncus effusus]